MLCFCWNSEENLNSRWFPYGQGNFMIFLLSRLNFKLQLIGRVTAITRLSYVKILQ